MKRLSVVVEEAESIAMIPDNDLPVDIRFVNRARRRHGSETVFNKRVIAAAERTLKRFK